MHGSQRRLLTREEAARLVATLPLAMHSKTAAQTFDVSLRTIRRWVADGRLVALRTGPDGGRLRITRDSVIDLMVEMSALTCE